MFPGVQLQQYYVYIYVSNETLAENTVASLSCHFGSQEVTNSIWCKAGQWRTYTPTCYQSKIIKIFEVFLFLIDNWTD